MFARATESFRNFVAITLGLATAFALQSCMYAMPAPTPPSQEQVRIETKNPQNYVLELQARSVNDYKIPNDGRVTLQIPSRRSTCRVYLFGVMKVGGGNDPAQAWRIVILENGKTVRTWPLEGLYKLAPDASGYRTLKLDN